MTVIARAIVILIIVMNVVILQKLRQCNDNSNDKILRSPSIQRPRHNDEVLDRLSDRVAADRP